MTVWNTSVSWSKFKLALDCPKQLQYILDGQPRGVSFNNYYSQRGTVIQFIFEQYYNQKINLKDPSFATFEKVVDKLLGSSWFRNLDINMIAGKTLETFKAEVREQALKGHKLFSALKVVDKPVQSEQNWNATFRNFRMFGKMDFVVVRPNGAYVFDGKGNVNKDADPRQIKYYALILMASGLTVRGGGYLYWQHDFDKVDLSLLAMKEFIDSEFARGREIFERLRGGTQALPPYPSPKVCNWCGWKNVCPASVYKKDFPQGGEEEVGLVQIQPAVVAQTE